MCNTLTLHMVHSIDHILDTKDYRRSQLFSGARMTRGKYPDLFPLFSTCYNKEKKHNGDVLRKTPPLRRAIYTTSMNTLHATNDPKRICWATMAVKLQPTNVVITEHDQSPRNTINQHDKPINGICGNQIRVYQDLQYFNIIISGHFKCNANCKFIFLIT